MLGKKCPIEKDNPAQWEVVQLIRDVDEKRGIIKPSHKQLQLHGW